MVHEHCYSAAVGRGVADRPLPIRGRERRQVRMGDGNARPAPQQLAFAREAEVRDERQQRQRQRDQSHQALPDASAGVPRAHRPQAASGARTVSRAGSIGAWSTVASRVPQRVSRIVKMPQYVWKTRIAM